MQDEHDGLKPKRARLANDVCAMLKSADQLAEEAERSKDISSLLSQSNALRKASKEKSAEVASLDDAIAAKALEVKALSNFFLVFYGLSFYSFLYDLLYLSV